jgi:CheY-like chemotaxis protein
MSKRILVVEDQPDNRQIIRDMLAPTDYEITEAKTAKRRLQLWRCFLTENRMIETHS